MPELIPEAISNGLVSKELKAILSESALWKVQSDAVPTLISELSAGLNHNVYLLRNGPQHFVLKIFRNNKDRINSALEAQQLASEALSSKHKLTPTIFYSDPAQRYFVMEYIEGSSMQDKHLDYLTKNLQDLHKLKLPANHTFTPFHCEQYVHKYWNLISETMKTELNELFIELSSVIRQFDQLEKTSLCHNDLVADNILFSEETSYFIDWEYAQINNPWFDLANVVLALSLTNEQSNHLLSNYWQSTPFSVNDLHTSLCAVLWLDVLWNLAYNNNSLANIASKIKKLHQILTEGSQRQPLQPPR